MTSFTKSQAAGVPAKERRYRGQSAEARREERREKLIAAGLELFGTRGYAATSVKSICDQAGLSPRYFYEHFDDREDLLLAVCQTVSEEVMHASLEASTTAEEEIEARVRAGIRAYIEPLVEDRRKAWVLFAESIGVSEEIEKVRRAQFSAFAEFVRDQSVALGAVDAKTDENRLIAYGLIGANHEILYQGLLEDEIEDVDLLTEQCCTIFLGTSEWLSSRR